MARYNLVNIGSVYLTSTGISTGKPCKTQVSGLPAFKTTKTGQIVNSANGTPFAQLINFSHKGLPIEIAPEWMTKSVFDSVVAIIEAAKNAGSTISLGIVGDTGSFTITSIPLVPRDIDFDRFSNNYIFKPVFRFIST